MQAVGYYEPDVRASYVVLDVEGGGEEDVESGDQLELLDEFEYEEKVSKRSFHYII